tara:strand:- start:279 stop:1142 length:864 start_codon:yes stop_codon:yes gene_type:complete
MNKSDIKKRLILGSANFSQKYGAENNKIHITEIKKILNLAKLNNINQIDTADSYLKDSSIFRHIKKKFIFITKIKPDSKWNCINYCEKKIKNQIKKLNYNKIQTLLFHDVKVLYSKSGPVIFNNLVRLKEKGYFKKIGVSIYDTKCLKFLTSKYKIDVVQCPYNILDRRIIETKWLNKLKKRGIEIHVRSIFLQGLLSNKNIYKKKYFIKWKKKIANWFSYLKNNHITPVEYCLNDLLKYDFDQIIVGINKCDNLREILNFKLLKNADKMVNLSIKDNKLIDPRKWK